MKLTSVQWAISCLCVLTGVAMLSIPTTFNGELWTALRPSLWWLGWLWVIAGASLVFISFMNVPSKVIILAHFIAAGALLSIVYNAFDERLGTVLIYSILAIGTILSGFIRLPEKRCGYYWPLIYGITFVSFGIYMFIFPEQFISFLYDPIKDNLSLFGLMFVVSGVMSILTFWCCVWPSWIYKLLHLPIVIPSFAFGWLVAIPAAAVPGIFLYFVLSSFSASAPWVMPLLKKINPQSYESRLAGSLIILTTLPILVIASLTQTSNAELMQFIILVIMIFIGISIGILAAYKESRLQQFFE